MARVSTTMVLARAPLFSANWTGADAAQFAIDGTVFTLKNGVTRADFETQVAALRALTFDLAAHEQSAVLAQGTRDAKRASLRAEIDMWRKAAIYALSGTAWEDKIPTLPGINEALDSFLARARQVSDMWLDINNSPGLPYFAPPLVLRNGLAQAQFATDILALENIVKELATLENSLPLQRGSRDGATMGIYELMGMYRDAVLASFDAASPVVTTLPTLQPRDTGHTPAAVDLSGALDPISHGANLSWTASTDADLNFYQVKLAPGPRYKDADAIVLATLQPGVLNYAVEARFLPGGSVSNAVVSVVLTDGREKQSNAVKFEPPL